MLNRVQPHYSLAAVHMVQSVHNGQKDQPGSALINASFPTAGCAGRDVGEPGTVEISQINKSTSSAVETLVRTNRKS